jgi:uncharacterized membrane protein YphA (DoxX/SURF4 family)
MNSVSYLPAIGRLLIAAIFLISGLGKVAAPAMTQAYIASTALPVPMLAYVVAIVIELVDGLFLVIGFQTRATAAVLAAFVEPDDAIFAEFHADATVIATGRPYHQDYVFYLRARGGKTVLIREYFDAVRLVAAFGQSS